MGYVLKLTSIARVKLLLDEMVQADRDCSWPTDDPRLSYYLREGIAASKQLGMKEYAELSGKFIIRGIKGRVLAELRNKPVLTELMDTTARMTVHEVSSVMSIVGAAIKHKAREMYFPDAHLEDPELQRLEQWAVSAGYEVLNHEEEGVTVRRAS